MTVEEGGTPTAHRWQVWDGQEVRTIGLAFLPSPEFLRDYVPFYGQFAQTMTLWSPDAGSFAFAGLIGDQAGVWVQDLDAAEPTFVVEGGASVRTETSLFDAVGGMAFFERLVARFYQGVAADPVLRPL
jgi:hypothetical protein